MSKQPDDDQPPAQDERINDAISELIDDDTRAYYVTTLKEDGSISCNWESNRDNRIGPYPDLLVLQAHLLQNYAHHSNSELVEIASLLVEAGQMLEEPRTDWTTGHD